MTKVFGIGISKTGTTSLNRALSILGYKTIMLATWNELGEDDFEAATHEGIANNFQQCDRIWPGSKFICTLRSHEPWLRSLSRHHLYNFLTKGDRLRPTGNRGQTVAIYDAHMKRVAEYFEDRGRDLLYLDVCGGEGWEPLCRFLGKPVPSDPFPHVNQNVGPGLYLRRRWKDVRKIPKRMGRQLKRMARRQRP